MCASGACEEKYNARMRSECMDNLLLHTYEKTAWVWVWVWNYSISGKVILMNKLSVMVKFFIDDALYALPQDYAREGNIL